MDSQETQISPEEYQRLMQERDALAAEKQQSAEQVRRLSILQGVREVAASERLDLDFDAVKLAYEAGRFSAVDVQDGEPVRLGEFVRGLVQSSPFLVKAAPVAPDLHAGSRGKESGESTEEARREAVRKRYRI